MELPRPSRTKTTHGRPQLTPLQFRIWNYMVKFQEQNQLPPSLRQITQATEIKLVRVHQIMHDLETKGWVKITAVSPRGYRKYIAVRPEDGDVATQIRWRSAKIWAVLMPCSHHLRTRILSDVRTKMQAERKGEK